MLCLRIQAWCVLHCDIGALRGHDDQSVHEAHSAESTDVSECPLSAPNLIMLISDHDMNHLVFIHYESEIYKRSSEAGGGESYIIENLSMFL